MILIYWFVFIAAITSTLSMIIYFGYQEWRLNQYTVSTAATRLGMALIIDYVAYLIIARFFHWPVISGTWISDVVYGILAVIETFCFVTFARYTIKQRNNK